jgi:hypothetical protein
MRSPQMPTVRRRVVVAVMRVTASPPQLQRKPRQQQNPYPNAQKVVPHNRINQIAPRVFVMPRSQGGRLSVPLPVLQVSIHPAPRGGASSIHATN